jgi:multimeric flavodoxin WrbA
MSKKVLIVAGSPRKAGNSRMLCDEFMKGAVEAQHNVELVSLAEKEVRPCTGCYACRSKGKCAQQDDMKPILASMISADVIVMATPVYFYTMCAQMKALIDRCVARYTEISGKEFYFIVTAADGSRSNMTRTLEGFRGFTSCLRGAKEKGVIYGVGAWEIGDIKTSRVMQDAYEMGKKL